MALAIDGFDSKNTNPGTTSAVTLTTANANDVIIVYGYTGSGNGEATTPSVSDTAGLTWNTRSSLLSSQHDLLTEFYAIAASALSADVITYASNAQSSQLDVIAFGISGANTGSPFDSGGPQTNTNTGTTGSTVNITTTNANDMIIGGGGFRSGTPVVGSGFNDYGGGAQNRIDAEYLVVSATQSALAVTFTNGGTNSSWTIIADAVQQASGVAQNTMQFRK